MADRQAIPPSDGDLDEPPGGGSPAAGSTGAQGAQDVLGSDREAFARFQRFLQMEREEGRGPTRHRRRREREEEEGDDSGEGRGASADLHHHGMDRPHSRTITSRPNYGSRRPRTRPSREGLSC